MNLNQCAMKTMTCKQLGGACEQKFSVNTFEEISLLSKQHGKEMFQKKRCGTFCGYVKNADFGTRS